MSNPYDPQPDQPAPYDPNAHGQPGGYGPPGSYGPPGGYGQPAQAPNDGVSIAGFVLSLLCCTSIIGLILGFVGLSRTKNGQRRGRGLAIAAVIIGIIGTLLFAAGVVGAVWVGKNMALPETTKAGQCVNILFEDAGDTFLRKVDDCSSADGKVVFVGEYREAQALPNAPENFEEFGFATVAQKLCTMLGPEQAAGAPGDVEWDFMTSAEGEPDPDDLVMCFYVDRER